MTYSASTRARRFALATIVVVVGALAGAGSAAASPGEFVAEVEFSEACGSGIGVGVAYDGSGHLWVSCFASNPDLLRTNVNTGVVEQTYNISSGLGSLAYDSNHNALWAGWGGGTNGTVITYIQLNGAKEVVSSKTAFEDAADEAGCGLDDGLGYDATDSTLYVSPDCATVIHQRTESGALVREFPWAGTECFNSGLAIGGEQLFEGSDGCSHVWVVNKASLAASFDFSTFTENDPNHRDEGLSCDPITFKGVGKQVMWSKEAYSPNRAIAFEIPPETCGFGGKAPKATETTTTLSGGGKSGESISVGEGTEVTDQATLTGANAPEATGTVSYKVYSDNECSKLVADAGTVNVTAGSVPPSNPETLGAGTYYWQASYSGDENNEGSSSRCGSEIETVTGAECTKLIGSGHWGARNSTGGNLNNKLSTTLTEKQELGTTTPNGEFVVRLTKLKSATCVGKSGAGEFSGTGTAKVNGAKGYEIQFAFSQEGGSTYYTLIIEKEGVVIYSLIHQKLNRASSEHLS